MRCRNAGPPPSKPETASNCSWLIEPPSAPAGERLAIERDYLDNISLAGDLAILLRTPRAIVRGDGAY